MDDWGLYRRATQAKRAGDFELELTILLEAIAARVPSATVYERAAILLEKRQRFEQAIDVLVAWRHQATATGGNVSNINKRRARLERRLGIDRSVNAARFTPPPRASGPKKPLGSELPTVPERDPWADVMASQGIVSSGAISVEMVVGDKTNLGPEFDRPLPSGARGEVDFVFVGGAIRYVDLLGSGEVITSDLCSAQSEAFRLSAMVIDPNWVRTAVAVCERLIKIRSRGLEGAFAFQAGNDSWPFREICREVAGRSPVRFESTEDLTSVQAPERGHWLYCQDLERFVRDAYQLATIPTAPTCVLYRGVSRNDLFLHALLDAMSQRGQCTTTCVLPDIPSLRSFAARFAAHERLTDTTLFHLEEQMFTAPIKPARRGVVIQGAYGTTHYIASDGLQFAPAEFESAVDYLEASFQVRLMPSNVLHDSLLRSQSAMSHAGVNEPKLALESPMEQGRRAEFEAFYAAQSDSHRRLLTLARGAVGGGAIRAPGPERGHWWNR